MSDRNMDILMQRITSLESEIIKLREIIKEEKRRHTINYEYNADDYIDELNEKIEVRKNIIQAIIKNIELNYHKFVFS